MSLIKKLFLSFVVVFVALQVGAGSYVMLGGEIPWPLADQRVVTVDNSKGLWKLRSDKSVKYFNVEMLTRTSGRQWIRVSHLDPMTFEVLSWGVGVFESCSESNTVGCSEARLRSSFSDIFLGSVEAQPEDLGRYITMLPNANLKDFTYLVRLVEIETSMGRFLGLSTLKSKRDEHFLGTRVLEEPLRCVEDSNQVNHLSCFLD